MLREKRVLSMDESVESDAVRKSCKMKDTNTCVPARSF